MQNTASVYNNDFFHWTCWINHSDLWGFKTIHESVIWEPYNSLDERWIVIKQVEVAAPKRMQEMIYDLKQVFGVIIYMQGEVYNNAEQ